MESVIAKIKALLETRFQEEEFKDCFLVEIKNSKTKLQIFLDSDEGISYRNCVRFSRYLEEYLDTSEAMGSKYTLEVSSPGTDNPIKQLRQLPKHIGRKFRFSSNLEPDVKVEAKLTAISGSELSFEIKKKKEITIQKINFEDLNHLKVIVSF